MAKISWAVMAHPARADLVADMLGRLDVEPTVMWDEQEGPPSSDKERRWAVGRAAWTCYDPEADWHIVLQDDALPSFDVGAAMTKALDHIPGPGGLSLYLGTRRPSPGRVMRMIQQSEEAATSWMRMQSLNWGVAIGLPTQLIFEMCEFGDRYTMWTYDTRVGQYLIRVAKLPTYYTWPSLVDHRDVPSLLNHGPGRVAWRWHDGSALELDWSGGLVTDGLPAARKYNRRPTIPYSGPSKEHR